ncbi:MAG: transglutaminase family protein [Deltaproteobacteria bacterium]|nr:MAG: transglutaminase family protein [Deltaproteobacteria bacterium]
MEFIEYLKPTMFIESDAPAIRETAHFLATGKNDVAEKARSLFYFVRDEIRYNVHLPKLSVQANKATEVLKRGEGYCVQKAVLLAALARALGIPARLRFADILNHRLPEHLLEMRKGSNLFAYHGYNELYIDGRWIKVSAIFNLDICKKHGFVPVEFDGRLDAILPEKDRYGRPHIEYIKDRGPYNDLPLDDIISERKRIHGVADFYEEMMKQKGGYYGT